MMTTATQTKYEMVERIVELARQPMSTIRELVETRGSDGEWYFPAGFPFSVQPTSERRIAGYAACDKYGVTFGKRYPTREACVEALEGFRDARDQSMRDAIKGLSVKSLTEKLAFWEAEKARFRA